MVFHRRRATVAFLAVLGLAGCHAGNTGTLASRSDAPLTKSDVTADRLIADHNRNVVAVRSLKATPGIEVAGDPGQRREKTGHVNGRMAFERSRSFRLELSAGLRTPVADIGSNEEGFWFWVSSDQKDSPRYVCDYAHLEETGLAVTLQPDWIIEAMGLREISEREAATVDSRPGDPKLGEDPGTLILTQIRKDPRSKEKLLTKETVFSLSTSHIIEHRLYAGAKKTLLARARIENYAAYKLGATEANPDGVQIDVPQKFKLEWIEEKFSMTVAMSGVVVNPPFTTAMRNEFFTEPQNKGSSRVDLALQGKAQAGAVAGRGSNYRGHETLSPPRSGPGSIQLAPPDSSVTDMDGSYRKAGVTLPPMPNPSSTDVRPDTMSSLGIVGAPLPQSYYETPPPATRWSSSRSPQ